MKTNLLSFLSMVLVVVQSSAGPRILPESNPYDPKNLERFEDLKVECDHYKIHFKYQATKIYMAFPDQTGQVSPGDWVQTKAFGSPYSGYKFHAKLKDSFRFEYDMSVILDVHPVNFSLIKSARVYGRTDYGYEVCLTNLRD